MKSLCHIWPLSPLQVWCSILAFGILVSCTRGEKEAKPRWTFVSMPDFLNVDCDYPQPGWEEALSYILSSAKAENPAFLMVAGDLVMGHWDAPAWNDQDTIAKYSARYYSAWKERMRAHGLTYYTAIGDHEVGDNPWRSEKKWKAVPMYKEAFARHLSMPQNGPEHMRGTAFWWRHQDVLFISVDVFEEGEGKQGHIQAGVTGRQLQWFKEVLLNQADARHKIVMGHTPVLSPVRKWSSSGLILTGGRQSEFWQTMRQHEVDLYLCGEVHAITCTERDGIMQIAHGGLIGYNTRTNYLVVDVFADRLQLELKEIDMLPSGPHLWQTKNNRPLEKVAISPENRRLGFRPVGRLTIDKTTSTRWIDRKGYFHPELASSDEAAVPIFKGDNGRGAPVELPKVVMDIP